MLGGCWVLRGAQGAALQISGRILSTQAMGGSPAAGQEGGGRGCWVLARGWLRQRVLRTAVRCPSSLLPAVQKDSGYHHHLHLHPLGAAPGPSQNGAFLRCTEHARSLQQCTGMGMLQGEAFAHVPQAPGTAVVAGTKPPQPRGDAELGTVPVKVADERHLPMGGLKAPKSSWARGPFYG